MSEAEKRKKDRKELDELFKAIEPAKNEDIARRAIALAEYYIVKAENQAKHIRDLEARNDKERSLSPLRPEENPFASCGDCYYHDDEESICVLRRCIHAVAELKECYKPRPQGGKE